MPPSQKNKDRITNIDALRGFALFGILVVNIIAFSSVYYGTGITPPNGTSSTDSVLAFLISAIFELKFYLLFSFLFGYSMTLQIKSAEKAGKSFLPRIFRRQAGLFFIGTFHANILFHGDILTTYAVLGLILLAFRNIAVTNKIRLAKILIISTSLVWFIMAALNWVEPDQTSHDDIINNAKAALAAYTGDAHSIITQHQSSLLEFLPMLLLLQAPCALAMFLIGFSFGERGYLENRDRYHPYLKPVLWWGALIGLTGGVLYAYSTNILIGTSWEIAGLALTIITSPFLTASIIAAVLMILDAGIIPRLSAYFASAGRMALSNYLFQSLVCALIFHGYGFGLMGALTLAQTLLVAVAIFAAQLPICHWWLKHYNYGPVEWLLRAITIKELPKWKASA